MVSCVQYACMSFVIGLAMKGSHLAGAARAQLGDLPAVLLPVLDALLLDVLGNVHHTNCTCV